MRIKFIFWILLLLFASCQKGSNMVIVSLTPKNLSSLLDPRSINYTNEFYLLENLTTRLVSLDESGDYKLELAESIKEGELELNIRIKESYFSNGDRIQLTDVKNTFLRILNTGSSHVQLSDIVKSIDIVDNNLRVAFKKKSKSFLYFLSLPDMGILHKTQYAKDSLKAEDFVSISSGPFLYKVEGEKYFLLKNRYFKLSNFKYPDLVELIDPFDNDVLSMAVANKLDLGQVSLRQYLNHKEEIAKSGLRVLGVPSDMLTYIYFNEKSKNFKNSSHRRWLRKVIDSNFLVPEEYSQLARRTKQYFPPESKAYLEDRKVNELLNKLIDIEKPTDFPEIVNIHTFTTGFDVSIEPLIRRLESMPNVKIKIHPTVSPSDKKSKLESGEIDIFMNMTSTDFRVPMEAINFEFYSRTHELQDKDGQIKRNYEAYLDSTNSFDEVQYLQQISALLIKSDQMIPLFHNAIPVVYSPEKVDLDRVNHLSVLNFWKISVH